IWTPSRNVVISTRDATFDPTQGYSPTIPPPIDDDNYLIPTQDEVSLQDSELSILPKNVEAELKTSKGNNEFTNVSCLLTPKNNFEPERQPTKEKQEA
ncbi:hypothetical protein GcM3_133035, partial [Golovinomyces cichoracearum]